MSGSGSVFERSDSLSGSGSVFERSDFLSGSGSVLERKRERCFEHDLRVERVRAARFLERERGLERLRCFEHEHELRTVALQPSRREPSWSQLPIASVSLTS